MFTKEDYTKATTALTDLQSAINSIVDFLNIENIGDLDRDEVKKLLKMMSEKTSIIKTVIYTFEVIDAYDKHINME